MMEAHSNRGCILETADSIRILRQKCIEEKVPESIQDGYEAIIDHLIELLGISQKQRDLFWTLTDPE